MADEQSGSPLRRWRPFYGAFGAIDDAIESASSGEHTRAAHRDVRVRILLLLRAAATDDDDKAEQLCAALDGAMEESLKTLLVAPVPHAALSSTGLASAVGALGNHGSPRIRGLVGDVVRGWRKANVATATTVKEKLEKLSGDRIPSQGVSTVVDHGNARGSVVLALAADEVHKKKLHIPPVKMLPTAIATKEQKKPFVAQSKKMEAKKPVVAQSTKMEAKKPAVAQSEKMEVKNQKLIVAQSEKTEAKKSIVAQSEKMEATKRKLREGYEEAEKAKRQKTEAKNRKPVVAQSEKTEEAKKPVAVAAQGEKMEATKRKLREGYEEAEKIKRQHIIRKIDDRDASRMFEQSQRKMHRGPARCRISAGVRRSLLPSLQLV